jgi:FkbM family methyltransferase
LNFKWVEENVTGMQTLSNKLMQVEKLAKAGKLGRLLHHPIKYIFSVGYRSIFYPVIRKGISVKAFTFFGVEMRLMLPAATDIYLTGGKSDSSEIRLAKFMIRNLKEGDCFFDVGAHFGYYSMLAATIVGDDAVICSFEPSTENFDVLQQNTAGKKNIHVYNAAVSDTTEDILFYEFPALYSEFSTTDIEQFETEAWLHNYRPVSKKVSCIVADQLIISTGYKPSMIKIDVEGGEYRVIKGLAHYLAANNCVVLMEYLCVERKNDTHKKAVALLKQLGFDAFAITDEGTIDELNDVDAYMISVQSKSENIVFKKQAGERNR